MIVALASKIKYTTLTYKVWFVGALWHRGTGLTCACTMQGISGTSVVKILFCSILPPCLEQPRPLWGLNMLTAQVLATPLSQKTMQRGDPRRKQVLA